MWLGIYENPRLRLLSFFHELGHRTDPTNWSKVPNCTRIEPEWSAWVQGLILAFNSGVTFTGEELQWAVKALLTYNNYA